MTQTALTREQVLKASGTVLDVMIAVHIFKEPVAPLYLPMVMRGKRYYFIPEYSTDISAAWNVLDTFKVHQVTRNKGGFSHSDLRYRAIIGKNQHVAYGDTAPEAICKAALLAVLDI